MGITELTGSGKSNLKGGMEPYIYTAFFIAWRVMEIKLTDRFSEPDKFEKCPVCLMITQSFLDMGENVLGCLSCGCMFLRKEFRADIKLRQRDILLRQQGVCEVCKKKFSNLKVHLAKSACGELTDKP